MVVGRDNLWAIKSMFISLLCSWNWSHVINHQNYETMQGKCYCLVNILKFFFYFSNIPRRISGQPVSNSSPISKSQSWPLAINAAPREGGHGASPQVAAAAGSAVAASMDDSAVEAQVCLCSMCTLRFPSKMSVVIKVLQSGIIVIVTKFVSGSKLFQIDEISVFAFNLCTSRKTSEPRSGRRLPPRRQAPRPRKSSSLFRIYTSPSRWSWGTERDGDSEFQWCGTKSPFPSHFAINSLFKASAEIWPAVTCSFVSNQSNQSRQITSPWANDDASDILQILK